MAEAPRSQVDIKDFLGLNEAIDPQDAPPGVALVQLNCCSLSAGELQTRGGYKEVNFEAG